MRLSALVLFLFMPVLAQAQKLLPVRARPPVILPTALPSQVLRMPAPLAWLPLTPQTVISRQMLPERSIQTDTVNTLLVEQNIAPGGRDESLSLRRSGSIRRGIVAGNRRSLGIESNFQMQLSGKLAQDVEIEATLTDRSIPIQPEGTTRQLQELDRVYIELRTPAIRARLGNFDVQMDGMALAPLRRKVQGIGVQVVPGEHVSAEVVGAVSRGVFHVQHLTPLDGVQGPYRLTGKYGEPFVLILAGTERVYLDGELLTRGEDADYTVDYATAEIFFTSRRPITAEQRIRVEFEYVTGRYTRSLLAGEGKWRTGKWFKGQVRVVLEADGRALLGGDVKGIALQEVLARQTEGDVLLSSARQVPFDPEAPYVLYSRRDTLVNGQVFSYFRPISVPEDTVYRVSFTYVGEGKGSYRRAPASSTGIAYTWVGRGKGAYEPVVRLQPPQALQIAGISGVLEPLSWFRIAGEFARAVFNRNRFSVLPGAIQTDGAYTLRAEVSPDSLLVGGRYLTVRGRVYYRQLGRAYRSFDRLREMDFARTWNVETLDPVQLQLEGLGERLQEVVARVRWGKRMRAHYRWQSLKLQVVDIQSWAREGDIWLRPRRSWEVGYRFRHVRDIRGAIRDIQEGHLKSPLLHVKTTQEKNLSTTQNAQADSLWSYSFFQVASSANLTKWGIGIHANGRIRQEQRMLSGTLQPAFLLKVFTLQGKLQRDYLSLQVGLSLQRKRFTTTFERLGYRNAHFTGLEAAIRWMPQGGWLRLFSRYEAGSERVARLEEVFVRVGTELGQYVWVDINGDRIRQLDEYLPESTPYEGTYIKLFVPSRKLEPATRIRVSTHLYLHGSRLPWGPAWLKRWESSTTLSLQEQSTWPHVTDLFLLRQTYFRKRGSTLRGTLHIQQQIRLRDLFYRFTLEPHMNHTASLQSLTYGTEDRSTWNYILRTKRPVTRNIESQIELHRETIRSRNEIYRSRTYHIQRHRVAASLQITPRTGSQLRSTLTFTRTRLLNSPIRLTIWKLPVEGVFRLSSRLRGSLQLTYSLTRGQLKQYDWQAYELTEGRGTGITISWNGTFSYQTGRHSELEIGYSGRKAQKLPTVQTFRMTFSLLF